MREDRRPRLKNHIKRANEILDNVASTNTERLAPAINKLLESYPHHHPHFLIGSLIKVIESSKFKGDFKKRCYIDGFYFCRKNKVNLISTYSLKSHRNRLNKTITALDEKYKRAPHLLNEPDIDDYEEEDVISNISAAR